MRFLVVLFLLCANSAVAQTYPSYVNTTVNDFAELLSGNQRAVLAQQLVELRRSTGVEMTIVTLNTQSDYAPGMTLEAFATGLFNHWGVGNAARNDGVMVLVIREDRAMRIELGKAYARDWDRVAQGVVDDHFLPAFKQERYARGITEGTAAVIDEIVQPFLDGEEAPDQSRATIWIIVGLFTAGVAFHGRRGLGDAFARLRRCPNCGARSLRQKSRTVVSASKKSVGRGLRRRYCTLCDYEDESGYVIAKLDSGSSDSFGGGSSGGGGASGRW